MAVGRCGTVVASVLLIACALQVGGCGDSSPHSSGGTGTSSSGAPSAGSGGATSDGGTVSAGGAGGSGGRVPIGGIGATSGSGEAGRGVAGDAANGGTANGGTANGGTDQSGTGGSGVSAGAGGAIAAAGGTVGGSGTGGGDGTAGMPEFSCPELGSCYDDCTSTGVCVRTCAFDFFTLGSDEDVAQLAALQCERLDGPLIVYGDVTTLTGLETIHTVTSQVAIYDAPELEDISGLSGLKTVGGRLLLSVLAVTEIEFPALQEVGAGLLFVSIPSAERILLPKLTSVREDCDINSTSATEMDLDALEHVGGKMRIFSNPNLTTLNELPSLVEAQSLEIALNDSFPQCEADAIAARLSLSCPLCIDNSEVCP